MDHGALFVDILGHALIEPKQLDVVLGKGMYLLFRQSKQIHVVDVVD